MTGEVGEIIVKSSGVMLGYWKDPESTSQTLKDGRLYTGDKARKDEHGFYYFVDRKKDTIRRKGENISPREVVGCFFCVPLRLYLNRGPFLIPLFTSHFLSFKYNDTASSGIILYHAT